MATLNERFELDVPGGDPPGDPLAGDPLGRLATFYEANGYRVVERTPADPATPATGLVLERGEAGAGWWTSNMTALHTQLELRHDAGQVTMAYTVDTSGQKLTDTERSFWNRERGWAAKFMRGETDEPRDMRPSEEERAEQQSREMFSTGLWAAGIVFILVVALFFLDLI